MNVSERVVAEMPDKDFRDAYVESRCRNYIAYQIKVVREQRDMSQTAMANAMRSGQQSVVSRMEDPDYGRLTLTTLLRAAAALDSGLLVKLCSHEDFLLETSDLSPAALKVAPYSQARVHAAIYSFDYRNFSFHSGSASVNVAPTRVSASNTALGRAVETNVTIGSSQDQRK